MKIDFDSKFMEMNGDDLKEKGKILTLKAVCINALVSTYRDEPNPDGEEKVRRYDLAVSIYKGHDDFKTDDIVLMKTLISKAYSPIVVGQAWKMLEAGVNTK